MSPSRVSTALVYLALLAGASSEAARGCLLAERLRVVAPHLSEEEVLALAHGNMNREVIPYALEAAVACTDGTADIFPCDAVDLLSFLPLSAIGGGSGNDLWGWQDPVTGTEYALVGRSNGTAFVDLSDPENPVYVGNLPTHTGNSSWRDIKVYADHAFVVSDSNSNHGVQVFDLTQLRAVTNPPVTFPETAHYPGFGSAHNIAINEDTGFAYAIGSGTCNGGPHMIDVSTPTSPAGVGCVGSDGYTHDTQCVVYHGPDAEHVGREICFNSNEDTVTIVDVTDKANPVQLSRNGYTDHGYTHQGWLTADHRHFIHDDELDEIFNGHMTRTYTWDVSDLDQPVLAGFWDGEADSIDHNQYIKGEYTYQANYTRGLRILRLLDPSTGSLEEAAFFDTFPESDAQDFSGAWSTYPFFASGIVLVSDISRGLFVLRPLVGPLFEDGFESGDTSAWDLQVPLF
ncbi:MAG: choice-of-anchor B family protein [Acidobacteriota bacterium]|nr:choice-of-anchor B family protein [Acidobacteriota bacterium]MDH3524275.1 choice-of-anchor B family protein [Acidobacteriota bacterium]